MKTDKKIAEYWYEELVDSLRLISSELEVQEAVLPEFVHIPDEVLNSFPIDSLHTISNQGLISDAQLKALVEFDSLLEEIDLPSDYDDMLEMMRSGSEFRCLREKAIRLLENLGHKYEKPNINAIYIKGS
ncbi:hypothetical protein AN944_04204 [Shewanella sp. P1-14-1]|uniref:hypothetical protein n=1 Tax=Shewanella sp. P1-14-1 TaxID=1723761 RepID=UPI0006D6791B|nr:hypothetical protein [Shewanella sp. P1-14-1]KPZ66991.1 hypothetical protein AN944_04204 [Shewanella sp. P1-14-1]